MKEVLGVVMVIVFAVAGYSCLAKISLIVLLQCFG